MIGYQAISRKSRGSRRQARLTAVATAGLLLLYSAVFAADRQKIPATQRHAATDKTDRQAQLISVVNKATAAGEGVDSSDTGFSQQLISVDFRETTLDDALNELRAQLKINMVVYWPAITTAGYARTDPVTLKLEKAPGAKMLLAVLEYVSSGRPVKLDYEVDRGVVEINRSDQLVRRAVVKVYYIADLLQQRSSFYSSRLGVGGMFGSQQGSGRTGQGGASSGGKERSAGRSAQGQWSATGARGVR